MFAKRTNWELTPNKISDVLQKFCESRTDFLDLTVSNPTRCSFRFPDQDILSALHRKENMSYAPEPRGFLAAREAVCAYYRTKGLAVDPQRVFLTASTSEGYSFLFRLLGDPHDAVLFPLPSYPLFDFLVGLNDLEMKSFHLQYSERWRVDEQELRCHLSEKIKAAVFVNPNNPTGHYLREDEIDLMNMLCAQHHIPIICDEVFEDYPFDEHQTFPSMVNNERNLTFVLGGLSKALGMPQMKLSWIVVSGPEADVQASCEKLEVIADTYLSTNTPSQHALRSWMELRNPIQQEILQRIRANHAFLESFCLRNGRMDCLKADGGWNSVIRIANDIPEEEFVLSLLEKDHVSVHPGYFFDFTEGNHMVVSLLVPENDFKRGVEAMDQALQSYQG